MKPDLPGFSVLALPSDPLEDWTSIFQGWPWESVRLVSMKGIGRAKKCPSYATVHLNEYVWSPGHALIGSHHLTGCLLLCMGGGLWFVTRRGCRNLASHRFGAPSADFCGGSSCFRLGPSPAPGFPGCWGRGCWHGRCAHDG